MIQPYDAATGERWLDDKGEPVTSDARTGIHDPRFLEGPVMLRFDVNLDFNKAPPGAKEFYQSIVGLISDDLELANEGAMFQSDGKTHNSWTKYNADVLNAKDPKGQGRQFEVTISPEMARELGWGTDANNPEIIKARAARGLAARTSYRAQLLSLQQRKQGDRRPGTAREKNAAKIFELQAKLQGIRDSGVIESRVSIAGRGITETLKRAQGRQHGQFRGPAQAARAAAIAKEERLRMLESFK